MMMRATARPRRCFAAARETCRAPERDSDHNSDNGLIMTRIIDYASPPPATSARHKFAHACTCSLLRCSSL